jgi:hypothetical protein
MQAARLLCSFREYHRRAQLGLATFYANKLAALEDGLLNARETLFAVQEQEQEQPQNQEQVCIKYLLPANNACAAHCTASGRWHSCSSKPHSGNHNHSCRTMGCARALQLCSISNTNPAINVSTYRL